VATDDILVGPSVGDGWCVRSRAELGVLGIHVRPDGRRAQTLLLPLNGIQGDPDADLAARGMRVEGAVAVEEAVEYALVRVVRQVPAATVAGYLGEEFRVGDGRPVAGEGLVVGVDEGRELPLCASGRGGTVLLPRVARESACCDGCEHDRQRRYPEEKPFRAWRAGRTACHRLTLHSIICSYTVEDILRPGPRATSPGPPAKRGSMLWPQ